MAGARLAINLPRDTRAEVKKSEQANDAAMAAQVIVQR